MSIGAGMARRTSIWLSDDLDAAVRESGLPLAELVRRGLRADSTAHADRLRSAGELLSGLADLLDAGGRFVPAGAPDTAPDTADTREE
jgi:hypothetical protein